MKTTPVDSAALEDIAKTYPTPFYIYDEAAIRHNARRLYEAFSWLPSETSNTGGYRNYFAVKALPNPNILQMLFEEGMGCDCSSLPELLLASKLGIRGQDVMFTSNTTPQTEFETAQKLDAIINFDSLELIDTYAQSLPMPSMVALRYNPGNLKRGNTIIGAPTESKYGLTREQTFQGYKKLQEYGAKKFALHAMVASNELNHRYFVETTELLFQLRREIQDQLKIDIEHINIGGGIGIPYRPEETPVDIDRLSEELLATYREYVGEPCAGNVRISMENGRVVTGPYGYLVSRVLHKKNTYKSYIGLDANMANLMRPGMYGAYHHITVAGKEKEPANMTYDITGSLCENNDKFAIDRPLPDIDVGDLVFIHDSGAHGHSMGFNYNGKLRCAELLLQADGGIKEIRRAETVEDYFCTIIWP